MDNRPIGVFDSGLGGLTAVKVLQNIMPHENIIYFGDTGRVPYGNRSREIIMKYARQDIDFLKSNDVKMIIVACGTVSSVAGDLIEGLDLPSTSVLKPTARAAAAATKNGRVGVIGTTATIRSGSYRRELASINPKIEVFERDCPLFVPLVENGFVAADDKVTQLVAERYLLSLKEQQVDTLIMGCTHYPIISKIISHVMGDGVTLIDSGREAALYAAQILEQCQLLCDSEQESNSVYFVSDTVEGFSQVAGIFLGHDVKQDVRHVAIG